MEDSGVSICDMGGEEIKGPVTILERLAYAICAHDYMGGEGHLTDQELNALEGVIANFPGGLRGQKWSYPILNLAAMERERRLTQGKELALMHMIVRDWPNYMGAAKAALGVLAEIPEVAFADLRNEQDIGTSP